MKKLLALLVMVAMLLPSCQKIEDRINALEDRVDQIEGTQIATINEQIEAINSTLPKLSEMDAELEEYIESLQTTATNLQNQITSNDKDIEELKDAIDKAIADADDADDALKAELVALLNTAKAEILAQLESTKTALEAELAKINTMIAALQAKDTELEGKITALEEYVNNELEEAKDWATATFATLQQYNAIVEDIAAIKTQIETLNTSLTNLEERLNTKIASEIAKAVEGLQGELARAVEGLQGELAKAVEGLQGELAAKVTEIATAYTTAIATAKEEVTTAYTESIAAAISTLENAMKQWVNEQLTGYYTIAEVDAALEAMQDVVDEGDRVLAESISGLSITIDAMKLEITEAYAKAIDEAINTNNGVIDGKIANEVAAVNARIDREVASINARIDVLEQRINDLEEAIDKIKALDLIFEVGDNIVCMAGETVEFSYTVVGGDNDTVVECFGDGGWSADVISSTSAGGRIKATAPDNAIRGKIVVLATSGAGGTCVKTIRCDQAEKIEIIDAYANKRAADEWDIVIYEHDYLLGNLATRLSIKLSADNIRYVTNGTYSVANGGIILNSDDEKSYDYSTYHFNNLSISEDIDNAVVEIVNDLVSHLTTVKGVFRVGDKAFSFEYSGNVRGFFYDDPSTPITEWDSVYISYAGTSNGAMNYVVNGTVLENGVSRAVFFFDLYSVDSNATTSAIPAGVYDVKPWSNAPTENYCSDNSKMYDRATLKSGQVVITDNADGTQTLGYNVTDVYGVTYSGSYTGTLTRK